MNAKAVLATSKTTAMNETMTDHGNIDRASQFEELRFAKRQQWYIATAAVTLLAAIFWIERNAQLSSTEKAAATVFIVMIMGFGIWFLFKLQNYMKTVRLLLDPSDPNSWWRNGDVLFVLAGVVLLAAIVVLYFFWIHGGDATIALHPDQGTEMSSSPRKNLETDPLLCL
jgi:amino acid transporter